MSNNGRNLLLMQLNQLSTKMGETQTTRRITTVASKKITQLKTT